MEKLKLVLFWGTLIVTALYILNFLSLTILGKILGFVLIVGLFKLIGKYIPDDEIDKISGKGYLNKIVKKIKDLCKRDLKS